MKRGGIYLVTGPRNFRGHVPGTRFAATLDPALERRATTRGDISLVETVRPSIQPGSLTLPRGWLTHDEGGQ